MKDIRVNIQLKNNILLNAMEAKGMYTNASLARATNITDTVVGSIINLEKKFVFVKSGYSLYCKKISSFIGIEEEDLFPARLYKYEIAKIKTEIDSALLSSINDTNAENIAIRNILNADMQKAIQSLPERESKVIMLRYFEDRTLESIGKEMGVYGSSVRQIEHRAIARLRKNKIIRGYKGFSD